MRLYIQQMQRLMIMGNEPMLHHKDNSPSLPENFTNEYWYERCNKVFKKYSENVPLMAKFYFQFTLLLKQAGMDAFPPGLFIKYGSVGMAYFDYLDYKSIYQILCKAEEAFRS